MGALTHRPTSVMQTTIAGKSTTAEVTMSKCENGNNEAKKPRRGTPWKK